MVGSGDRGLAQCVVVPTRNEPGNVGPLVERLSRAFAGTETAVIFVDDSDDETPAVIAEIAAGEAGFVELIHREVSARAGGLGSAVLTGLQAAADKGAAWTIVMDGDLQHPPEVAPCLVAAGESAAADVVVASRYIGSGSSAGLSTPTRVAASSVATKMAKAVFPVRLRGCSDPMSGFFAVRLDGIDLAVLRPDGFKILLEILARCSGLHVAEVPFEFGDRYSGQSKASWREGAILVRRLTGLRLASVLGRHSSRTAAVLGFGLVGLSGMAVNNVALWFLVSMMGLPLLPAAAIATQASSAWNFVLTDRLVFRRAKARPGWQRFVGFAAVNNAVLLVRLPLLAMLVRHLGLPYVPANVATLVAAFVVRFVVSDSVLFRSRRDMTTLRRAPIGGPDRADRRDPRLQPDVGEAAEPQPTATRRGPTDLVIDLHATRVAAERVTDAGTPWRYDIHGLVKVASVVRLRELDYFAAAFDGSPDIVIRAGRVSSSWARGRARVIQYAAAPAVSYQGGR